MNILVTGSAGFIGFHFIQRLLSIHPDWNIVGIDNFNDYYDISLKDMRSEINYKQGCALEEVDLANTNLNDLFDRHEFDRVIHLAAQAGVRYSLENPFAYISSNIIGFQNILENCKKRNIPLIYASSSSVYGGINKMPWSEKMNITNPTSLYAATKVSNEVVAQAYHNLFGLPLIGLRFFTVYGPWGRPDMAIWIWTEKIWNNEPIPIFNHGRLKRDFTYIDDIVSGVYGALFLENKDHRIYNLGNNKSVPIMNVVKTLEKLLGKKAQKEMLPMQLGDIKESKADIRKAKKDLGYNPKISIEAGLSNFVSWWIDYHTNLEVQERKK